MLSFPTTPKENFRGHITAGPEEFFENSLITGKYLPPQLHDQCLVENRGIPDAEASFPFFSNKEIPHFLVNPLSSIHSSPPEPGHNLIHLLGNYFRNSEHRKDMTAEAIKNRVNKAKTGRKGKKNSLSIMKSILRCLNDPSSSRKNLFLRHPESKGVRDGKLNLLQNSTCWLKSDTNLD